MIGIAIALLAASPAAVAEKASVIAAENGWERAEVTGDVRYLDALLAPDYVSVSGNGNVYTKDQIESGAKRQAEMNPHQKPAVFDASSSVFLYGDLALVRHHGAKSMSVDVMQRRNGRWVAVYSQHSKITGQKDVSD